MNEFKRANYLQAMGIDMYVPRFSLPGAAPSPTIEPYDALPEEISEARQDLHEPLASEAAALAESALSTSAAGALAEELSAPVAVPPASRADTAIPEPGGSLSQKIQFTLNVWHLDAKLMIVDSHSPKSGLPTLTLLRNILMVKNLDLAVPAAEAIQWPIVRADDSRSTLAQARDFVSAFVHSRIEDKPVACIWLMGRVAFQTLAEPAGGYEDHLGTRVPLPGFSQQGLVLPSLHDMLVETDLKKICWGAISSVRFDGQ